MSTHATHLRAYRRVFAALLALTVVTVVAAYINLGAFNNVVALAIAGVKAFLVVLVFMHLREATGITRVFVAASLAWLVLLIVLVVADVVSRDWITPSTTWLP